MADTANRHLQRGAAEIGGHGCDAGPGDPVERPRQIKGDIGPAQPQPIAGAGAPHCPGGRARQLQHQPGKAGMLAGLYLDGFGGRRDTHHHPDGKTQGQSAHQAASCLTSRSDSSNAE